MVVLYSKLERLLDVAETRRNVGRDGSGVDANTARVERGVVEDIVKQVLDSNDGRTAYDGPENEEMKDGAGPSTGRSKSTTAAEAYLATLLKDVYEIEVQTTADEVADARVSLDRTGEDGHRQQQKEHETNQGKEEAGEEECEEEEEEEETGGAQRSRYYRSEQLAALGTGFQETMRSFTQLQRYLKGGERRGDAKRMGADATLQKGRDGGANTSTGTSTKTGAGVEKSGSRDDTAAPTRATMLARRVSSTASDADALRSSLRNLASRRGTARAPQPSELEQQQQQQQQQQRLHEGSSHVADELAATANSGTHTAPIAKTDNTEGGTTAVASGRRVGDSGTDVDKADGSGTSAVRIIPKHVDVQPALADANPSAPGRVHRRVDGNNDDDDEPSASRARDGPTSERADVDDDMENDALAKVRRIFEQGLEDISSMKATKLIEEGARRQRIQAIREVNSAHASVVELIGDFDYRGIRDELNTIDERMRAIDALFHLESDKKKTPSGAVSSQPSTAYGDVVAKVKRRLERTRVGGALGSGGAGATDNAKRREDPNTRRDRNVEAWLKRRGMTTPRYDEKGVGGTQDGQAEARKLPSRADALSAPRRGVRQGTLSKMARSAQRAKTRSNDDDDDDDDDDGSSSITSSSAVTETTYSTHNPIPFREIAAVFNNVVMQEQVQQEEEEGEQLQQAPARLVENGNAKTAPRTDLSIPEQMDSRIDRAEVGLRAPSPPRGEMSREADGSALAQDVVVQDSDGVREEGRGDDSELRSSDSGLAEDVFAEIEGETVSQMILLMRKQQQQLLHGDDVDEIKQETDDPGVPAVTAPTISSDDADTDADIDGALTEQLAHAVYTSMMMREAQQNQLDDADLSHP